jgi:RNA polymerase sigma factor (sigma-70 family)
MRIINRLDLRDADKNFRARVGREGRGPGRGRRPSAPPKPLDDERRALAESAWDRVCVLPAAFTRRHPRLRDDFFSDAGLRLVQAAADFDPARNQDFVTYARWRVGLAMRETLRHVSARSRDRGLAEVDFRAPGRPESHPAEESEAFDALVRELPGRRREVLIRLYRDGLDRDEVAALLGTTVSAVSHDARNALRQLQESIVP